MTGTMPKVRKLRSIVITAPYKSYETEDEAKEDHTESLKDAVLFYCYKLPPSKFDSFPREKTEKIAHICDTNHYWVLMSKRIASFDKELELCFRMMPSFMSIQVALNLLTNAMLGQET